MNPIRKQMMQFLLVGIFAAGGATCPLKKKKKKFIQIVRKPFKKKLGFSFKKEFNFYPASN